MSCCRSVNTSTHVVSDQLGEHKSTGQPLSVGSSRLLVTSRPLSPSSFPFRWIWLSGRTTERSFWGAGGRGYNSTLRLAKRTQQRRQQTRPCQELYISCAFFIWSQHTHTVHNQRTNNLKSLKAHQCWAKFKLAVNNSINHDEWSSINFVLNYRYPVNSQILLRI